MDGIQTLDALYTQLQKVNELLEHLADEHARLVKENKQLKDKLFWMEDTDDGKC